MFKYICLRSLLFTSIAFISLLGKAQPVINSMQEEETAISKLMVQIAGRPGFDDLNRINAAVFSKLKALLNTPESLNYSFDSLKHIGKVVSPDNSWKLFTWNIPLPGGYHKIFGLLQVKRDKASPLAIYELVDSRTSIPTPMGQSLTPQQWYGALYYQVVKKKADGRVYYALIGVDPNDMFTSKRVIDVLYFDEQGNPKFGAPIFDNGKRKFSRIIFEYSAKASMVMRYVPESDMIVFDHLSPSEPRYSNDYRFYGPDFSYDGFKFEKGRWFLHSDLDMRNTERPKPKKKPVVEYDPIKP